MRFLLTAPLLLLCASCFAQGWLFTSFRGNKALKGDRAWIVPQYTGMLRRDPFMAKGPDGDWHLIRTWGWTRKEWVVFWATTITGRYPDTEGSGDSGYNHRLYSMEQSCR